MGIFKERLEELFEEEKDRNYKCTRAEFAKQCGITTGQLSGYLQGNGANFCATLARIAQNKQVAVAWLIGASNHRFGESIKLKNILDQLPPQDLYTLQIFAEFMLDKRNKFNS